MTDIFDIKLFSYNPDTKTFLQELSTLQLKGELRNPISIKGNNNTVKFYFTNPIYDPEGDEITGWEYKGEYDSVSYKLIVIND